MLGPSIFVIQFSQPMVMNWAELLTSSNIHTHYCMFIPGGPWIIWNSWLQANQIASLWKPFSFFPLCDPHMLRATGSWKIAFMSWTEAEGTRQFSSSEHGPSTCCHSNVVIPVNFGCFKVPHAIFTQSELDSSPARLSSPLYTRL